MNTTDNPQPRTDTHLPDPARSVPDEPRERPEPVEATTAPEAVRAAQVAREDKQHAIVRGRGVEWVRPTDLIARHSAHAAGRGLDFQAELARRTRTPIGAGVRRLGDRARWLPPMSIGPGSWLPVIQVQSRPAISRASQSRAPSSRLSAAERSSKLSPRQMTASAPVASRSRSSFSSVAWVS